MSVVLLYNDNRLPMKRITFKTKNGGHIDIVSDYKHAKHRYYILREELERFVSRAKELGAPPMSKGAMKILISEELVHSL